VEKAVGKISSNEDVTLQLKRNPKIVNNLKKWSRNKNLKLVAFKLTSHASEDQVREKVFKLLEESHADAVVQNDVLELKNRQGHKFQIYHRENSTPVNNVDELIGELVKVGGL
jgi:phosphopantothenoylcysteine decarboxylase / phosphopantothenate---cysteine ligase